MARRAEPIPHPSPNPGKDVRASPGDFNTDLHENAMSYHPRTRRPRQAMGDLLSTLTTAVDVANDPYMPEVVCRIQQLKAIQAGQPVAVCTDTPDGTPGILQGPVMPALRAYVYAQQNPWVYPVAAVVVLGIPFLLGKIVGEGRRAGGQ